MNNKILTSVMVIGIALMMGVASGIAYFYDSAETSGSFQAGHLELQVSSYGSWDMGAAGDWTEVNEEGLITFDLDDIKPGDSGNLEISIHVYDNPAFAQIVLDNVYVENDLDEALVIDVEWWNEDEMICSISDFQMDNKAIPLPGTSEVYFACEDEIPALENCKDYTLVVNIEFPTNLENPNQYQGGLLEFDMKIEIVQARHNDNPFGWCPE